MSMKCVRESPIDDSPAMVQVMVWRQTGDRPLSDPAMAYFTEAYMGDSAWMS